MEESSAPETRAARHWLYIAVLFKFLALYVITQREPAVETEREFISPDIFPEVTVQGAVPYFCNVLVLKVAKYPRPDLFLQAAHITTVTVPEEVTWMHVSVPGDE